MNEEQEAKVERHLAALQAEADDLDRQQDKMVAAYRKPPKVGDIIRQEGPTQARLLLVTQIVPADAHHDTLTQVMLLSNEVEMATDFDVVLTPEMTGLPYSLLALAELYAMMLPQHVSRDLRAFVAPDIAVRLRRSVWSDGRTVEDLPGRGLPLQGLDDPRRQFRLDELRVLQELTGPSMRILLDGRT